MAKAEFLYLIAFFNFFAKYSSLVLDNEAFIVPLKSKTEFKNIKAKYKREYFDNTNRSFHEF